MVQGFNRHVREIIRHLSTPHESIFVACEPLCRMARMDYVKQAQIVVCRKGRGHGKRNPRRHAFHQLLSSFDIGHIGCEAGAATHCFLLLKHAIPDLPPILTCSLDSLGTSTRRDRNLADCERPFQMPGILHRRLTNRISQRIVNLDYRSKEPAFFMLQLTIMCMFEMQLEHPPFHGERRDGNYDDCTLLPISNECSFR